VAGVSEPRREAGLLLANLLGRDRAFLITHSDAALNVYQLEAFEQRVNRRAAGEPLQYITGTQEFFGLKFEVNSAALIPRPETELLVESALEYLNSLPANPLLLDVGTGTGCITIALLHERPDARAIAVDASSAAIQLASRNAARHCVNQRVSFLISDALSTFAVHPEFDLVVSNPPYIPDSDWETLQREVRDNEPRLALTSGRDGLRMIRQLVAETAPYLRQGGYLIFEIGFDQRAAVEQLIDNQVWQVIAIRSDLQGIPRTVVLRKR
jgi:release factor glutamine methyltransferase